MYRLLTLLLQASWLSSPRCEVNSKGYSPRFFFLLTFANLASIIYQIRVRSWPATTGELLMSATETFGVTEAHPSNVNYVNAVSYGYTVDSKSYVGRRLSPWAIVATHNLKAILENQLKGLAKDGRLAVFYNPAKPQKAFLKQPGVLGIFVTLGFAVFCFVTPMLAFG